MIEEIVDEATCTVAMMRKPIVSEEHLMGAFWTTVRLLLRHHREGRYRLRVGSQTRSDFEAIARHTYATGLGPEDVVELNERAAWAADFAAQLTEPERRIVGLMAIRGVGMKRAARLLGVSPQEVKAAVRSSEVKLDRIAVIAAAGRMCSYRRDAIESYLTGSSALEVERRARSHLTACTACRASYAPLLREMRGREFQRRVAVVFLPAPAAAIVHPIDAIGRGLGWVGEQLPFGGSGERVVEVLGGAGVVKAAAAGGAAVVMATATITAGVHSLEPNSGDHARAKHRHEHRLASSSGRGGAIASAASTGATASASRPSVTTTRPAPPSATDRAYREFSPEAPASTTPRKRSPASTPIAKSASVSEGSSFEHASSTTESTHRSTPASSGETSAAEREFGGP